MGPPSTCHHSLPGLENGWVNVTTFLWNNLNSWWAQSSVSRFRNANLNTFLFPAFMWPCPFPPWQGFSGTLTASKWVVKLYWFTCSFHVPVERAFRHSSLSFRNPLGRRWCLGKDSWMDLSIRLSAYVWVCAYVMQVCASCVCGQPCSTGQRMHRYVISLLYSYI